MNPPLAVRLEKSGKKKPPAVPAGMVEIRPCVRCAARMAAPEADLGKVYACPECGLAFRALAAAGPFANPASKPTKPAEPVVPPLERGGVAVRPRADPTPLVSSVGVLNLIAAAFCALVLVVAAGRVDTAAVWAALAVGFVLIGLAVLARWRWGWWAALLGGAIGAALTAFAIWASIGVGVIVFGVYAVYALAVMLVPRSRDEFRPPRGIA